MSRLDSTTSRTMIPLHAPGPKRSRSTHRVSRWIAIVALTSCARSQQVGAPMPAASFKVLVYNVHAGKDAAGKDNLQRVAEVVRDVGADVVLLQEVDKGTRRSGGVDQPAEYARRTG